MKILQLRLQNLNSLVGDFTVDFTAPAYVSAGIFAIIGPTGSGKSTVLDAICLGLYGETPRLGRITQSENEIMSRLTGECTAEVTFACSSGTFVCKWHQHRARKSPSGRLAAATHEISDAHSGSVLESRLSRVPQVVEEKTGLSFERFTRSVLLAQGRFGAFLDATADQRAPILEQITGTGIYSDISKAVHERWKREEALLAALEAQQSGVAVFDAPKRQEKEAELVQLEAELQQRSLELEEMQRASAWKQSVAKLERTSAALDEEEMRIAEAMTAFLPRRQQLQTAKQASGLAVEYRVLQLTRAQLVQKAQAMETIGARLAPAVQMEPQLRQAVVAAQSQLENDKAAQRREFDLQQQVRALDIRICELERQRQELASGCAESQKRLHALSQEDSALLQQLHTLAQKAFENRQYLSDHRDDALLEKTLSVLDGELAHLLEFDAALTRAEAEHREWQTRQAEATAKTATSVAQVKAAEARVTEQKQQVSQTEAQLLSLLDGVPLPTYRERLTHLQEKRVLTAKIASLEAERQMLRDGEPCPLCGSTNHPFVHGHITSRDEVEAEWQTLEALLRSAAAIEQCVLAARQQLAKLEVEQKEAAFQQALLSQQETQCHESVLRLEREIARLRSSREDHFLQMKNRLAPYGVPLEAGKEKETAARLNERCRRFASATAAVAEASQTEQQVSQARAELGVAVQTVTGHLAEVERRLTQLVDEKNGMAGTRRELYGDKSPEDEEKRWNHRLTEAEKRVQHETGKLAEVQKSAAQLQSAMETHRHEIMALEQENARLQQSFDTRCRALGFADELAFTQSMLDDNALAALEAKATELDDRYKNLRARREDLMVRLEQERALAVTDLDMETIQHRQEELKARVQHITQAKGAVQQLLESDNARREEAAAVQMRITQQSDECLKWRRLHGIVGSADGKKYRNFAQGLTFERLIAHANVQLARMSDRYLLLHSREQALEFRVMDNHQAGEIRTTRNLSGGESFIVSLALALGLAHMASRRVRIDSLFLDEGFGTLDDAALDTALDTLGSLHREGKLIGVISHVAALKERIPCQLQLHPQRGGVSRLEGPGCSGGRHA